jgi:hypothetical protein
MYLFLKRIALILAFWTVALHSVAQSIRLDWVKTMASSHGTKLVLDSNRSMVVLGAFSGTVDFDPGPAVFNMSSNGRTNIYIAKYDTSGNFIWAKQIGGQFDDFEYDMEIDKNGDVLISGGLQSSEVDLDPGPGVVTLPTTAQSTFLLRLDYNGNFVWVKQLPGDLNTLNIDAAGNIIMGGTFGGVQDFDPGPGVYQATGSGAYPDMAVVKLDNGGNFIWMRQIRNLGTGVEQTFGIKTDPAGNVFFAGGFSSGFDFDPGPGTVILAPAGSDDGFLLKLDAQGGFAWARTFGAAGSDKIFGLEVDKAGNVFTTGVYHDAVDFDPGPSTYTLTSGSLYGTCFISKLDGNGDFVYAKDFQLRSFGQALTIDSSNNLYISGGYGGPTDFDPGPGTYNVNDYGLFTAKLDQNGNFAWVAPYKFPASSYFESIYSAIKVDILKNVYFTGSFSGTVDFDPNASTDSVSSSSLWDTYLHRLSQCSNTLNIISVDTCDTYTLNNIAYSSPGVYYQTLTNSVSCDSIIQLNLSRKEVHTQLSATACGSYFWNGRLLTASGSYRDTFPAVAACDSVVQLDLTLTQIVNNQNITACGSYQFNKRLLTATGSYTDTINLANGCDSIINLSLLINPLPRPLLGADTVICKGDTITLSPGAFKSYRWNNNATSTKLTVADTGAYWVQVTDTNNCAVTDSIHITHSGQCDCRLNELTRVYPTPFTNFLIIDKNATDCEVRMNLYNMLGQVLAKDIPIQNGYNKIPLLYLPAGVYVYMLHSEGKILLTGKVLKK